MKEVSVALGELIAAVWKLGAEDNERLYDINGIVDRALHLIRNDLPAVLNNKICFSHTNVGLRCLEWPQAAQFMQESFIAEVDGGSYNSYKVLLDDEAAVQLLLKLGLSFETALPLSVGFYAAVKQGLRELQLNDNF